MGYLLCLILVLIGTALYVSLKITPQTGFNKIIILFLCVAFCHSLLAFLYEYIGFLPSCNDGKPFGLAYGPLLYIAVKADSPRIIIWKKAILHACPFFICMSLYVILLGPERIYYSVLYLLISLSMLGYGILSLSMDRRRKTSEMFDKTTQVITVSGVLLIILALICLILTFTHIIPGNAASRSFPKYISYSAMLIEVLVVFRYQVEHLSAGIQFDQFPEKESVLSRAPIDVAETSTPQYQKSLLTEEVMDNYQERLNTLVKNKIFTDPELSLSRLATQMKVPKHHLTQLFNVRIKKNFSRYINDLRIEYACRMLEGEIFPAMEELSFLCGFNSKVSFYRNFKERVKCTPTEYRERI